MIEKIEMIEKVEKIEKIGFKTESRRDDMIVN